MSAIGPMFALYAFAFAVSIWPGAPLGLRGLAIFVMFAWLVALFVVLADVAKHHPTKRTR